MDGKKKPKKRGRKPKNLSTESKPKIEENEITENLIIKLNKNTIDKYSISSYNENDEKNEKIDYNEKSELCWNCCHSFNEYTFGIPLKYHKGIFYIYGDFCSLECGARYAFDNLKNLDYSEIYSNINLFTNDIIDFI